MDALGSVMNYLKGIRQDYVVLSDSDTVINAPLEDVLRRHIDTGADITAVCTAVPGDGQDTYFRLDARGRITDTAYGLHTPEGYRCLNIFVLRTELLIQLVTECLSHNRYSLRRDIASGHEQPPPSAKLRLRRLRRPHQHPAELLRPQHGAAGYRHPQRPVLPGPSGIRQGKRLPPSSYIDPEGGCVNSLAADGCDIRAA